MTKWFHKCNLDWLKARQRCLTASDVKELLPFTKTGRKRTVTDEMYLKVYARKMVNLTEDDCISTGAAARGHILEPFAIDRYNKEDLGGNEWLFYWDDVVITRDKHAMFELAFSPDAMSEIMDYEIRRSNKVLINGSHAATIGEVKSYSPERHMACGYTPKDQLEERWQIATAMAVCPSIENAYLMFYNPSMKDQLYIVDYDRHELDNEINIVFEIEADWLAWINSLKIFEPHYTVEGNPTEEQRIIESIMKNEELNPSGEKSVIL